MEFLRTVLGDDLYAQVTEKINAHNGNEANAGKQIKIGNLGSGEYVGKGKYDSEIEKLANQLTGKQSELDAANGLIDQFKRSAKGNDELQGKINEYNTQVQQLQAQLAETKRNSALKVALLSEKALDVDYLTFKLMEKLKADGKTLELDENENIKGWDDLRDGLKTQYPAQFESAKSKGVAIEANPLPASELNHGMTRAEFLRKPYTERAAFAKENPDAYKNIMNQ